jgi:hypothetical protein
MNLQPVFLELERALWCALELHLLPAGPQAEEAAFLFVKPAGDDSSRETVLRPVDHELVAPEGFDLRSLHAIELSAATRARVIKRAHDLSASLVEFHSHPFPYKAEFSGSDRAGLKELVPHVRWRLKGRPYVAIVVAPKSFDALVWTGPDPALPRTLAGIRLGEDVLNPTGRSERTWRRHQHA